MFYIARVISNKNFAQTGAIEVLLTQKYYANGGENTLSKPLQDLSSDDIKNLLPSSSWGGGDKLTVSCNILTPMCNGDNSGMFQLPQVNSIGVVAETQDYFAWSNIRYIWLGGLYGSKLYGDKVTIPNDDTKSDDLEEEDNALIYLEADDEDGPEDTISETEYVDKGLLLLKTKSTQIDDYNKFKPEDVDFKNIPSDNTIAISKEKLQARHNGYDNNKKVSFSDIKLTNDQLRLKRKVKTDSKEFEQNIIFTDDGITIEFNNTKKSCHIVLNSDGSINIDTDDKLEINAKGDISINTNKEMKFTSTQQMSFVAANQNLAKVISELMDEVASLKTSGSPALHVTDPTSVTMVKTTQGKLNAGYK